MDEIWDARSRGHLEFVGEFEAFETIGSQVHLAHRTSRVDPATGIRAGCQFFCYRAAWAHRKRQLQRQLAREETTHA